MFLLYRTRLKAEKLLTILILIVIILLIVVPLDRDKEKMYDYSEAYSKLSPEAQSIVLQSMKIFLDDDTPEEKLLHYLFEGKRQSQLIAQSIPHDKDMIAAFYDADQFLSNLGGRFNTSSDVCIQALEHHLKSLPSEYLVEQFFIWLKREDPVLNEPFVAFLIYVALAKQALVDQQSKESLPILEELGKKFIPELREAAIDILETKKDTKQSNAQLLIEELRQRLL